MQATTLHPAPCVAPPVSESGWKTLCRLDDIPVLGARVVASCDGDLAIFRNADDEIFAIHDKCPHKGGPLSQGIVHGRQVTCPLHAWKIELESGEAVAPDVGCTRPFAVKVVDGLVLLEIAGRRGAAPSAEA